MAKLNLEVVSELLSTFQSFPFATVDYQCIADQFRRMSGADLVTVQTYDSNTNSVKTEAFSSKNGILEKIQKTIELIGTDIVGKSWKMDRDYVREVQTSGLVKNNGIYHLTFGTVPPAICRVIEEVWNVGEIFGVGLSHQGNLMGSIIFILPKDVEIESIELIDLVAKQIAAILWRKKVEKALAESEERNRILVEQSCDAIFVTNSVGRYIEVNRAGCELFGDARENILNKRIVDYVLPRHLKTAMSAFNSLKREGSFFGEVSIVRPDGREVLIEIKANVLSDGNYLAIVRDITERRRNEEYLLKTEKLESVGATAGVIAHDINNLLAVMQANVEVMEKLATEGQDVFKYYGTLKKSIRQAAFITRQFLTFSKGGLVVKEVTKVSKLIDAALEFYLKDSRIKISLRLPSNLHPVEVDPEQIIQVIHNLIINARQAMPNGGTIKISARNVTLRPGTKNSLPPGEYVKIMVEDFGVGIPAEHQDQIFEPFFTTKPEGIGLGLAISNSIIKRHEGLIEVKSKLNKGTIFHIYLVAYLSADR